MSPVGYCNEYCIQYGVDVRTTWKNFNQCQTGGVSNEDFKIKTKGLNINPGCHSLYKEIDAIVLLEILPLSSTHSCQDL